MSPKGETFRGKNFPASDATLVTVANQVVVSRQKAKSRQALAARDPPPPGGLTIVLNRARQLTSNTEE